MNLREKNRIRRIGMLKSMIYQVEEADEEKLIWRFAANAGISRRTILEYLKILEHQDLIIREYGTVRVKPILVTEEAQKEADQHFEKLKGELSPETEQGEASSK